jgi:hypothetical protein
MQPSDVAGSKVVLEGLKVDGGEGWELAKGGANGILL